MDKETLSNYGWIVICVLVLAVMIALAGPFGNFVAGAVKSTTKGLFDVNQNALDAAGIEIDEQAFADSEDTGTEENTPTLNENGFYYNQLYTANVSALGCDIALMFHDNDICDVIIYGDAAGVENAPYVYSDGIITLNTSMGILEATPSANGKEITCNSIGATFALNADAGIKTDGTYVYIYDDNWRENWKGYEVVALVKSSATYPSIPVNFDGIPVKQIGSRAFYGNNNMTTFTVPDGIVFVADYSFGNCTKLTTITLPSTIETINRWAFDGCTTLTTINFKGTQAQWNAIGYTVPSGVTVNCMGN